jgi:hypothetical protein
MASQMGDKTVFGRYKKREKGEKDKKGENDIMSSAVALNMFSSGIYKVFKKEGDDNEQK